MSKIIEPSKDFSEGFEEYIRERYGKKQFSIAEAANGYFKKRYNTTDNWTDPKNITGNVKRKSESGLLYKFVGIKKSKTTGKLSKHYKLK